jgi:hypothetical protein
MAGDDLGTSSGMVHARYTKLASALILLAAKNLPEYHLANAVRPALGASMMKAQTNAEAMVAVWNSSIGMAKIPPVRSTTVRIGPMKRPRKTPHALDRAKNCSPRSLRCWWDERGRTRNTACLNRKPMA